MIGNRPWVTVATAAKLLAKSKATIYRILQENEKIPRRKIRNAIEITRSTVCYLCLKESYPDVPEAEYPLDCNTCKYF